MALDETAISGLLQYMTTPQLQELLDDDSRLVGLISDLDQVRDIVDYSRDMSARHDELGG